jgi:hypothetical protein
MMRLTSCWIALLAGTLLAPGHARADPRGIAEPGEPVTPEMIEARRAQMARDVAAWLPQLAGRFDVKGVFRPESREPMSARGKADCIAVGTGFGVQCVFQVEWGMKLQGQGVNVRPGSSFLAPAAVLFGFDPRDAVVRTNQLDTDGIAREGPTRFHGDTLTWCRGTDWNFCFRTYTPPHGEFIQMTLHVGGSKVVLLNLYMRREKEEP